jgi:hypothetical protein
LQRCNTPNENRGHSAQTDRIDSNSGSFHASVTAVLYVHSDGGSTDEQCTDRLLTGTALGRVRGADVNVVAPYRATGKMSGAKNA